jgi:hypothetical protein
MKYSKPEITKIAEAVTAICLDDSLNESVIGRDLTNPPQMTPPAYSADEEQCPSPRRSTSGRPPLSPSTATVLAESYPQAECETEVACCIELPIRSVAHVGRHLPRRFGPYGYHTDCHLPRHAS